MCLWAPRVAKDVWVDGSKTVLMNLSSQDHTKSSVGVASTMAQELGHNLGMTHDENIPGCYCPIPREGGGCIMTESIG